MKIEDKIGKDWFKRGYQRGYRAGKKRGTIIGWVYPQMNKVQTGLEPKPIIASPYGQTNKMGSKCCHALLKTVEGKEGTYYYICTKCGKPADIGVFTGQTGLEVDLGGPRSTVGPNRNKG